MKIEYRATYTKQNGWAVYQGPRRIMQCPDEQTAIRKAAELSAMDITQRPERDYAAEWRRKHGIPTPRKGE